jgi:two-component system, OmpR family, phosphate regulon response regulator PhoB
MPTILIADDDPSLRRLIRETLNPARHVCLEAPDGDAAWALLQQGHPDVALLDMRMPGRTGVEIVRALRADPALVATRVIMLSGLKSPNDREAGLVAGADYYLTKPFSPLELLGLIEDAPLVNRLTHEVTFSQAAGPRLAGYVGDPLHLTWPARQGRSPGVLLPT